MNRTNCEQMVLKILWHQMEVAETPGNLIRRRKYRKQQDDSSVPPRFAWLSKYTRNRDKQKSELLGKSSQHRFITLNHEDQNKSRTTSLQSRALQSVCFDRQHTQDIQVDTDNTSVLGDVNMQQKHNRSYAPVLPSRSSKRRITRTTNQSRPRQKFTIIEQKLDVPLKSSIETKFTPKSFKDSYFKEKDFSTKRSKTRVNPAELLTQKVHLEHHLPPQPNRNFTANTYKQRIPRCIKQRSEIPIRPWEHQVEPNDQNIFQDFDMI